MTQPTNPTQNPDDQLAEFADRVLDGKTVALASSTEDELHGLEETVMRLKRAFPKEDFNEKTLRRMQADFRSRARKAGSASRPAWQSLQSRQRLILASAVIAILAAIFIAMSFLTYGIGNIQGAAGFQTQGIPLLAALGAAILLIIWLGRRK